MEWQVLQYPQLSANAVKFSNQLNRQGSDNLQISSNGQLYMLRAEAATRAPKFSATVRFDINGRSAHIGLDAGLCDLLFSDWLPLEDIAALPNELQNSLTIAAFEPIANFFAEHSAGTFKVEGIECKPVEPLQSSLFFSLSSENGTIVGQAFIKTDEQTEEALSKIWQLNAKPAPSVNTENLPIAVEVVVGNAALSLEEFRQLRPGDVILLGIAFADTNKVYARISDDRCFSSLIDGSKLIIKK